MKKNTESHGRGVVGGFAWAYWVVEGHLGVVFLAWTRLLAFGSSLGIYNINMDD